MSTVHVKPNNLILSYHMYMYGVEPHVVRAFPPTGCAVVARSSLRARTRY